MTMVRPRPGVSDAGELEGDRWSYCYPDRLELVGLVGDRPNENALDAGVREDREPFGERLGGADGYALSQKLLGTMDRPPTRSSITRSASALAGRYRRPSFSPRAAALPGDVGGPGG
jgi:hypothetical protein